MKLPTVFSSIIFAWIHSVNTQPTPREPTNFTLTGHITPDQIFSFVYVPFNVSAEVTSMYVLQNYSFKGAGNSLDLGVFDPHGVAPINSETGFSGSRGWSGGFRNKFTISASDATPGYNAGPLLPGTWNVVLGPYATNRSGIDWTLDVSLSYSPLDSPPWTPSLAPIYKEPTPPTTPRKWLRGDFHMHTIYSDGRYLPSEHIAHAISYDLDFIFFSEHNTDSGNNNIGRWIPANASNLLIGRAIEVTTRHGHWQAIGLERSQQVEWRYTNSSGDTGFVDAATQVRGSGGLVSINHPFQNCSRCDWTLDWEHNDAIEVWNGRFDPLDEVAVQFWQGELATGKKLTALGGSDAHSPPDINGLPTTVVRVTGEKSQASIVEAVKRGRVYLVEGPGMDIDFGVVYGNGDRATRRAEIGDVVHKADLGVDAYASFSATGFEAARACFVSEKGYFQNVSLVDAQRIQQNVAGMDFVRVEIRDGSDTLLGLTNPVYFE
ncbi:uncharacterized protein PV07_10887 [Cladophialophora immunda]|uniref:Polymerase/histidinol phosphatase N-terminal domain-containing protein n=1 Tax=Cladophialophora immunda TaxID=569365 RepID=A0A0D1Z4T0_9EURO|nr:uncharacterized protein PV07_10887 [Cladophialophora immunda]KIW22606.1 hypothetical protein PV07_10887 [Cladophialophora immunda]OQV02290.1 hypothetical protein CLAIMM_07510 isoform 1 [Cladophialophora immunda]OQV02291.1 hypothetical protein CLAIMM_07510 isoform 2 [Cladophialophora immunda]